MLGFVHQNRLRPPQTQGTLHGILKISAVRRRRKSGWAEFGRMLQLLISKRFPNLDQDFLEQVVAREVAASRRNRFHQYDRDAGGSHGVLVRSTLTRSNQLARDGLKQS